MRKFLVFVVLITTVCAESKLEDEDYLIFDQKTTTQMNLDNIWNTNFEASSTPTEPETSEAPRTRTTRFTTTERTATEKFTTKTTSKKTTTAKPTRKTTRYPRGSNIFSVDTRLLGEVECLKSGKKCVSWYLCSNSSIVTDGSFIIDERMDRGVPKEIICPPMRTCCGLKNLKKPKEPSSEEAGLPQDVDTSLDDEDYKQFLEHLDIPKIEKAAREDRCKSKTDDFKIPTNCGTRNKNGIGGKIVSQTNHGGDFQETKYAQYGEFPWMVAVMFKVDTSSGEKKWKYRCGGSLIHTKLVITALHSLHSIQPDEMKVRAGEWNTLSEDEYCPHHERNVTNAIGHNEFEGSTRKNNILMLALEEPFEISAVINPICLPEPTFNFELLKKGHDRCFACGWGSEQFGKTKYFQNYLKKVEMPVVPKGVCQNWLNSTAMVDGQISLGPTVLCAGGEAGKDMCTGDGGSPLACKSPKNPYTEKFYLAGIVVAGVQRECGQAQKPGVYENVAIHKDWIDKQMVELELGEDYY